MRHHWSTAIAAAILLIALASIVEAKDCRITNAVSAWKHGGGSFKREGNTKNWVEYNDKGIPGTRFEESQREGPSTLVLFDPKREIHILLRDDLAGIRNKGEHQFQQLYQGHWLKTVDCT